MMCNPYCPESMLLVQGTSGGKLAVSQTVKCADYGVTIIIKETLALAADQKSKVGKARNTYGPVLAYQLDSIKKPHLVQILQNKLNSLKIKSNVTIFLYTSPECLMKEPWKTVVIGPINCRVLKLVCVDGIHLFVMFGLKFRKEFTLLKASFFRYLTDNSNTVNTTNGCSYLKFSLLLVTETINRELITLLEEMIVIKIPPQNYLWGN